MTKKNLYSTYLFPTFLQIILVAIVAYFLNISGFSLGYDSLLGMVLIALGGLSSALWGVVYQVTCQNKKAGVIAKDFFGIIQSIKVYALVVALIILDFSVPLLSNNFKIGNIWFPILLFFKALVFGGIEEIGWRYSFQPYLEKKMPYVVATLITFVCWGVWHVLFFYIDGSLVSVNLPFFFLGLLTNSFILSVLFAYSNSLWICVMTHALINAFSQIVMEDDTLFSVITKLACIVLSVILFYKKRAVK